MAITAMTNIARTLRDLTLLSVKLVIWEMVIGAVSSVSQFVKRMFFSKKQSETHHGIGNCTAVRKQALK
jgi:hypothetical protein